MYIDQHFVDDIYIDIYPLVMTNSLPWYRWSIEIDGLPIDSMVIFHGKLLNNQRVYHDRYNIECISNNIPSGKLTC